jgi:Flp pilus assembly protein TadG
MKKRLQARGGNTVVEFTLVGIPLIFVLFSTFEMARGMWSYHTLAHTVKEGTRWAVVHGSDCQDTARYCTKTYTLNDLGTVMASTGVGLDPAKVNVKLTVAGSLLSSTTLDKWIGNTTPWAGAPSLAVPGPGDVLISATYEFRSPIAMFWPGAGRGMQFGIFSLPAQSRERVQF